jgi:hypothetical protein
VANRKKTAHRRKPARPLPKVGTPADDAYRLEHSRRDLVDFGVNQGKGGAVNWLIAIAVVVLLAAGVVALIALS